MTDAIKSHQNIKLETSKLRRKKWGEKKDSNSNSFDSFSLGSAHCHSHAQVWSDLLCVVIFFLAMHEFQRCIQFIHNLLMRESTNSNVNCTRHMQRAAYSNRKYNRKFHRKSLMLYKTIGKEQNAHSFEVLLTERIFEYFITRLAKSSLVVIWSMLMMMMNRIRNYILPFNSLDMESHPTLLPTFFISSISFHSSFFVLSLLVLSVAFFFFFFFFSCFVLLYADNGIWLTNANVFLHLNINIELFIQLVSSAHFPHGIQFEICLLCVAHLFYMWNAFPFDHMNLLRIQFWNGNFCGVLSHLRSEHKYLNQTAT